MSDKVKKGRLKAALVALIVFLAVCALLGMIEILAAARADTLDYLHAGERWSADGERYAVINVYMEDSCGVGRDQLSQWEYSMNSALTEAAVSSENGASPWVWCGSFETELSLIGPKGSVTACVTVCDGEFFTFHEFGYSYGSGFLNNDSNPMGVVLDDDLAWKLFGADNIVGMTFTVSGNEYVVAGVAKPESEKGVYGRVYGTRPRMYMSAAGYSKIGECTFTTYETAIPNPVKGFADGIFENVVSLNTEKSEVIEVTDRFSLRSRFDNMKTLGDSWIRVNRIEYPYWENEARVYDYRYANVMIWEIVIASLGVIALLSCIILIVTSGYSVITSGKNIFNKIKPKKKRKTN